MSTAATNNSEQAKKNIWILERQNKPMKRLDEGLDNNGSVKQYIFEGPCAQFHEQNDNERFYDKDDYLSHMEYLLEEIQSNSLLGELDHSEDYMPSMKNISHMITDLRWDEELQNVIIQIKLLDTRDGKDAQAISDGGAPLYISSRASGFIDDDGNVTLERIYTYDIVYRPGFKNAKMEKMNESLGIKNNSIGIFEMRDTNKSNAAKFINNTTTDKMSKEFASKEDLANMQKDIQKYSSEMTSLVEGLKTMILEGTGNGPIRLKSGTNFDGNNQKSTKVNENTPLSDPPVVAIPPVDDATAVAQDDDGSQDRNDLEGDVFLAKIANMEEAIANMTSEKEALLDYIQMVSDRVNGHGDYMNLISQFSNKLADLVDMISGRVNDGDDYADLVAERVNDVTDYIQMVSERTNQIHDFSNLIAESQNKLRSFTKNNVNKINENLKNAGSGRVQRILENKNVAGGNSSASNNLLVAKGSITQRVDELLQISKKKTIDKAGIILETKYPLIKHLDEGGRKLFESMSEIEKKRVSTTIKNGATKENIIDAIVKVSEDRELNFLLNHMPKEVVPVWESMNAKQQNHIISYSKMKDIRNEDEAEMFWETLDLTLGNTPINVSENFHTPNGEYTPNTKSDDSLGYSDEDIDISLS